MGSLPLFSPHQLFFLPPFFSVFCSLLLWQGSAERGEGWQCRCLIFIRIANKSEWMPDQIRRRGENNGGRAKGREEETGGEGRTVFWSGWATLDP